MCVCFSPLILLLWSTYLTNNEADQHELGANNSSVGVVFDICMPVEKPTCLSQFLMSLVDVAISDDVAISTHVTISFAGVAILIDVAISVCCHYFSFSR